MKYVTSLERGRREEGRADALRTAALDVLEVRFGELPYGLREEIKALETDAILKKLPSMAAMAVDLEGFHRDFVEGSRFPRSAFFVKTASSKPHEELDSLLLSNADAGRGG